MKKNKGSCLRCYATKMCDCVASIALFDRIIKRKVSNEQERSYLCPRPDKEVL